MSTATLTGDPADYLTLKQAAERFPGLGLRYLQRIADQRRVPVYKVARNRMLVRATDLAAFIESSRENARP